MASEEDFIWIQSEEDEKSRVGLAFLASDDLYVADMLVRLEVDGFECARRIRVSDNADGLATFFIDLEEDWRGWEGIRRWEALEHGLAIEAKHGGRAIELVVLLRRDYRSDAWEVRVPMQIAPGEGLTQLVQAIGRSFPPGPQTVWRSLD